MIALVTPRLVLRPWTSADREPMVAMSGDPEVMRLIGDGTVRDRNQTEAFLSANDRRWQVDGQGVFAVETSNDRAFVGCVGVSRGELTTVVSEGFELGWRLRPSAWGHGYATEAAAAVLDWAFTEHRFDAVFSLIRRDNLRSQRVARKLGMELRRRVLVDDLELQVEVHTIDRDRWRAIR